MLNKQKLIEYFEKGIKSSSQLKIGTEHEKFILNKNSLEPLKYNEENGINDIFINLTKLGWRPVYEGEDNTIIALTNNKQSITLEPSGQFELSGQPLKNIHMTCNEITNHLNQMKDLSLSNNFILLGMGVEPNLGLKDFPLMPKERYKIMKNYMNKVGTKGLDMMQRTCSTQINLDFISEDDMIKKFRILLSLESLGTAIFANSPFSNGKLSSYQSLRSLYWMHTDNNRTGILPFVFNENFNFETYVEYALNVPMYFIKRNNKYIDVAGSNFKNFIEGSLNKAPSEIATEEDWSNHLTTLFPQVRLKKYLEIRSMDACSWDQICAQPAFWTGLLYDKDSLEESYSIISDWTDSDRSYLYKNVAKYGLKTKFKGGIILDIAKQFLNISLSGLKKRNNITSTGYDERKYLEPVQENLDKGISPADILIDKYKNKWGKSIIPIYEENIF